MVRRIAVAGAYALLTMLLARTVAADIPAVEAGLEGLAASLPGALEGLGPEPVTVALWAIGVGAMVLAGGAFLVGRATGSAFALLAVSTVGWFLFPYAEVPWTALITGQPPTPIDPPLAAWVLGALITTLGTAEVLLSARDGLRTVLERRRIPPAQVPSLHRATQRATWGLTASGLTVGLLLTLAYGGLRGVWSRGFLREPDLVWVPVLLGAGAALGLWLASRRQQAA